MKIGIITDIHSNIQALNAVLNEFDKEKVDKIICCGDIIGIGINPEETVQTLMRRKDILISVAGNHEQYLLKGLPENIHDDKRKLSNDEIENHKWNHSKLSKQSKEFLGKLELSKNIGEHLQNQFFSKDTIKFTLSLSFSFVRFSFNCLFTSFTIFFNSSSFELNLYDIVVRLKKFIHDDDLK